MKWFARSGYAARGAIYLVIGAFAVLAAFGAGQPAGTRDALSTLMSNSAGGIIAWALAAGLLFYALWRLVQSLYDTDRHGFDAKGIAVRAGLLVSGLTYLTLAVYAISLGNSSGGSEGGGFAETLSGFVGATWVSAGLAIVLAGVGVAHVTKAIRERYADHFEADEKAMRFIHPVSKIGLIARGSVFFVLSIMLALRALRGEDAGEPGLREALEFVQQLPAGWALLGAMGIGLAAFALYSFVEARYRRISFGKAGRHARAAVRTAKPS